MYNYRKYVAYVVEIQILGSFLTRGLGEGLDTVAHLPEETKMFWFLIHHNLQSRSKTNSCA